VIEHGSGSDHIQQAIIHDSEGKQWHKGRNNCIDLNSSTGLEYLPHGILAHAAAKKKTKKV
jgi:hypothetical protein